AAVTEPRRISASQAADGLRYPAVLTRRAGLRAESIVRGRQARPYRADLARARHARGWTTADAPPAVQHPPDDDVVAAHGLDSPTAPAAARVWSERHGWRPATSRRHPLGRGAAWPPPRPQVRPHATG
ncbi:hypothetical protein AB8850_35885, partial [Streptomyces griseorubens]